MKLATLRLVSVTLSLKHLTRTRHIYYVLLRHTVASLGWVSPGPATDGVALFFPGKLTFSVIALCKVMTFFSCRLVTTPAFRRRLSTVFFQNSATIFKVRPHCSQCTALYWLEGFCLSVCPSVTFQYCVQTNEDTIVRFSASGRTIPLVSGEVKFIRIFAGDYPQRGR